MMSPEKLTTMLRQTLDDFRLSRGEKQALQAAVSEAGATRRELALYRAKAFELAGEAMETHPQQLVVQWLEELNKVLVQAESALPSVDDAGDDFADGAAGAWFSPEDECGPRIVELFDRARQSVDVCVFTITDDRISSAIINAHRRGVAIRIITDDHKSGDLGSDIDRLRRAGVKVRMDRSKYHMHHKFAIFDGLALLTGSYNWTRAADAHNEENFIVTTDVTLVRTFGKVFERLWKRFR